jgi:hypothetical protein
MDADPSIDCSDIIRYREMPWLLWREESTPFIDHDLALDIGHFLC